ncbi:cell wall-binding repeat-containing protein [Peptostreptococcus russellii]|uniref:cell wall-binding repeat-containing protein n=1 Tax=Peptostreptococcus russellii TaxID=215200 RepID=UPI003F5890F3
MKNSKKIISLGLCAAMIFSNINIYASEIKSIVKENSGKELSQKLYHQKDGLDPFDDENMNSEVEIKDLTLKKAIIGEINRVFKNEDKSPDDIVTKEEMRSITSLSYNGSNKEKIKDLSGLEYAINLEFVELPDNEISDISAMSNLKNIKRLYMGKNNIEDISAISNCTKMTDISFDENKIEDIGVLSKLDDVKYLVLRKNHVKNIDSLSNMKNMETLNLEGNKIEDISPLKDLLEIKNLILYGNQIENIEALKDLKKLERLEISKNKIENFEAISWFSDSKNFGYSNQILNIKPTENKMDIKLKDIDGSNVNIMDNSFYYDRADKKYKKIDNIMTFEDGLYSYIDEGMKDTYGSDKRNISSLMVKNKSNKILWNIFIDPSDLDFEFASFNPEIKKLEVTQNEKVDIKKCILNAPKNSTVEVIKDVDTSEIGEKEGKLKVIFADGSTKDVDIKVDVIKKKSDSGSTSGGGHNSNDSKPDRNRISGKDRYETSLKSSKLIDSDVLVLSSGENFADSLSAQNIVNKFDAKLVLLNNSSDINRILKETNPKKVYIVGGENTINKQVEDKLRNNVKETKRIAGSDRYETSEKSLMESNYKEVGIADGRNFPDALSSSSISVKKGIGLKLVDGSKEYNTDKKVIYTYGGKRLAGADRYKTNEKINKELGNASTATFVDGRNYPDALSAINVIQSSDSKLLLVHPGPNYLEKDAVKNISKIYILGGENSVDEEIINNIFK